MSTRLGGSLWRACAVALAAACVAAAQDPPAVAGRLSYVWGSVSFEPAGVTDWVAATVNRPVSDNDQIFVDNGARAVVNVPGTAFRLGDRTAFEFLNLESQNAQVRLSEGTLDVRVRYLRGNLEVDTPNVAFVADRPGEYRVDTDPNTMRTLVTARDGEGQVTENGGTFVIRMGQQAVIEGQGQLARYRIGRAPGYDAFDRWVIARNERADRYTNARYVSHEMVGYEDLEEYGSWRDVPEYGEVWVPSGVPSGWTPYSDGRWVWTTPWGWTWIDDEPWGFAPFHYGRWAYLNGYWGWCPGPVAVTPVYAPALVAWVGFGSGVSLRLGAGPAVGWFPLGPRDVYVPAFTASRAYVTRINVTNTTVINSVRVTDVYNTYTHTRSIPVTTYMNRTAPGAIVAVPRETLITARPVRPSAVRLRGNHITEIRVVDPAPRVAPQVASVLGRPAATNVPRPPAAVLRHTVVARTAPPAPIPAFQQRQALLEKNPGRPVPISELRRMARPAPAARPPIRVIAHTRPALPAKRPIAPSAERQAIPPAQHRPPAKAQPHVAHRTAPPSRGLAERRVSPAAQHRSPAKAQPHVARRTAPAKAQPHPVHRTAPPNRGQAERRVSPPAQHRSPAKARPHPAHRTVPPNRGQAERRASPPSAHRPPAARGQAERRAPIPARHRPPARRPQPAKQKPPKKH